MKMTLTAKTTANSRTKNRLREHGTEFTIERVDRPQAFNGELAVLVTAPDGWRGWLPLSGLNEKPSNPVKDPAWFFDSQ